MKELKSEKIKNKKIKRRRRRRRKKKGKGRLSSKKKANWQGRRQTGK